MQEFLQWFGHWRKVTDFEDYTGWIYKDLLSGSRYIIVNKKETLLRNKASFNSLGGEGAGAGIKRQRGEDSGGGTEAKRRGRGRGDGRNIALQNNLEISEKIAGKLKFLVQEGAATELQYLQQLLKNQHQTCNHSPQPHDRQCGDKIMAE